MALLDDLKREIANGPKPLIVCGAGVSKAANPNAPDWRALIKSGIERVVEYRLADDAWGARQRQALQGDASEWIGAADQVTDRLGGSERAEFRRWLKDALGELKAERTDLLEALKGLAEAGCLISTTNYDGMLSEELDLPVVQWPDHAKVLEFLRGERDGILHLHGHWDHPETVVLGTKSYDRQVRSERRNLLQESAALMRPTLFVGCSADGLNDPDFARLRDWLEGWKDSTLRGYWLVSQGIDAKPDLRWGLFPIAYGSHDELPKFLRELAPGAPAPTGPVGSPTSGGSWTPGPVTAGLAGSSAPALDFGRLPETGYKRLVGREAELKLLDDAWRDPATNILSLVAEGGAGKSALTVEWLKRLQADGYRGAEAVLGWSFFSQGSQERATSADAFLNWAIDKLGIKIDTTSASAKGEAIAEALARRRVLLVLDGVEPLQHGPGPQTGQLKDLGLRAVLRRFAAVPPAEMHGLIVLTSRLAVADIAHWSDGAAPVENVEKLSDEAGAALLRDNGVKGAEKELQAASREFGGHPLALGLLASFLAETQSGDVRRRDRVRGLVTDLENPGHGYAKSVMASYEQEWLASQPTLLAMMHIVGLFDRPASGDCLATLRAEPVIEGLTDEIVNLDDNDWLRAVARLRSVRLLAPHDPAQRDALDAHPLVREWFGERLKATNEAAWKAAHGRLYEHLRDTTKEGKTPTLEDLAPLYQAVAHGCRAGRHQEALDAIYTDRICRRWPDAGIEFYASQKLGAIGSNLAAISWFFDKAYATPVSTLTGADQSWILGEAALALRAQGRFAEALPSMHAALRRDEEEKHWGNAAIAAANLSGAELLAGEAVAAVIAAERSVAHADRSRDELLMMARRATLAEVLHATGKHDEATDLFADAEQRQKRKQPEYPLLYSVRGYGYCDLLLANGNHAAARDRASQTLEWGKITELATRYRPRHADPRACPPWIGAQ
jgi:SIR2-like domain/AAA ATPase domain